jgi:hypothetical protein
MIRCAMHLGCVWLGCGFGKNCCELWAVKKLRWMYEKVQNRLIRAAVSSGKLCAIGEMPVILRLSIYQNTRTSLICSLFRM